MATTVALPTQDPGIQQSYQAGSLSAELLERIRALNIRPGEYQKILNNLGREPNFTELCMFSAMWSEHCSYKHTRHLLKKLPTEGPQILQGPGENAGIVDAGNGLGVAFKVESHNHPTYVEPFQGATTGVGGILRDIITMNARPIGLLNALRFGPMETAVEGQATSRSSAGNKYRFTEAVRGIGHYGNCTGIPTIGGDILFHPSYSGNPLVNAMAIGIMQPGGMVASGAKGVGNSVLYVGSSTGRDGMGGASFASRSLNETQRAADRPAVQVGDPFMGKVLLEAVLEAFQNDAVLSAQDMGAAGLTCATCEMADKGNVGMRLDLEKVPARETGMQPWEFLLSESQERFLFVIEKGREPEVIAIFDKWHVPACVIGEVIEGDRVWIDFHGERVADVPVKILTDLAPQYAPGHQPVEPEVMAERRQMDAREGFKDFTLSELPEVMDTVMLPCANLALPQEVFNQYDRHVRNSTVVTSEQNSAGLIGLRDEKNQPLGVGIAATLDGNPRYVELEPYKGSMAIVAEAARNLVAIGAEPLAVTNNLNYGDPETELVYYQLYYTIEGMRDACLALNTPVTGGNVSLYNTHGESAIIPSPVIGMVGRTQQLQQAMTPAFKTPGSRVVLVGRFKPTLGGSEYQARRAGKVYGTPPSIVLKDEVALQRWVLNDVVRSGKALSVDDVSLGGVLMTLLEGCFASQNPDSRLAGMYGARLDFTSLYDKYPTLRRDELLFGETNSAFVLTVAPDVLEGLAASFEVARQEAAPGAGSEWLFCDLGEVTAPVEGQAAEMVVSLAHEQVTLDVAKLSKVWHNGLFVSPKVFSA